MASSALSSRRGLLRRPKVCFVQPNPGRCHPVPPTETSCSLDPYVTSLFPLQDTVVRIRGYNPSYPIGVPLIRYPEVFHGEFYAPPVFNGRIASGKYTAPSYTGNFAIWLLFVWPDSSECLSFAMFNVHL